MENKGIPSTIYDDNKKEPVKDQPGDTGAYNFLAGGGVMGERIRSKDWSKTPLGPVEEWPQNLQTIVRIMLTSRQPIWIGWGPELIKLYNDPYISIVGGKHPEALGQPASVVWQDIWHDIEPMLQQVMEKDEGTYVESQLLIMERYGYAEETYYTFSYNPVPSPQGGVAGMICTNTDDTRRVIGERQLALLRSLTAETVDARTIEDACFLAARSLTYNRHDLPFALLYLLDTARNEVYLAGTSNIEKNHPAVPERVSLEADSVWPFLEVSQTGRPVIIENVDKHFEGLPTGAWQRPPSQAVAVPIPHSGETGKPGVLVIGLNPYRKFDEGYQGFINLVAGQIGSSISNALAYEEERRRAEALAEIDRAKTLFFSNVSHEFRTPLTLMLGPIEDTLAEKDKLTSEQFQRAEILHRNALRLLRLVNALLEFSRIEAGRVQARFEPTDLATITADLASSFRSAIEKAGMELTVETAIIEGPVYVDHEMREKIVLNLLSNAFKYTLQGQIKVRVTPAGEGNAVELSVTDSGVGIPENEMPHLFERFHRVEGVAGRTIEGTGIGLALVQELVKLHGGSIQVSSVLGQGSTFTVTIPLGSNHLPPQQVAETGTTSSIRSRLNSYAQEALGWVEEAETSLASEWVDTVGFGGELEDNFEGVGAEKEIPTLPRILLADDNADMRQYVRRLLSEKYTVEAVSDGQAALEAARRNRPDLILSDVMMPRLDGFGLLKALRTGDDTRTIPVIMLSARAGEEASVEGLNAGADDYLTKPFSARELLARVAAHLELARVRRESEAAIQRSRDEAERQRQQLYRTFMQAPVAISVLRGEDLVVDLSNPVNQRMVANRAIIGKPLKEAYPEIPPETLEIFYRVYRTGQPYSARELLTPLDLNNTGELTQRYWNVAYEPMRSETDQVEGIITVSVDVTSEVLARQIIEESEERFRTLADNISQLTWMADEDGDIYWFNQRWYDFTGTTMADMAGQGWQQMIQPEQAERVKEKFTFHIQAGKDWEDTFQICGKDGNYSWFLSRAIPIRDKNGKIYRWFGTNTDITERLELEKRRDEFIGIASHELKTPLTSIKGYNQLLERIVRDSGNEKAKLYLTKANVYIGRLNSLIADLLDVSRIQAGRLDFNIGEFDFDDLVKEAVESIQPTTNHELKVNGKAETLVTGDRNRLEQVITNLLTNAVKYSPQASEVLIRVTRDDANVELEVQDFGIGIARDKQNKIFDRFYRVESSAKGFSGLGIGLFISSEIIKRHQGELAVESEEGQGSTFSFTIPISPD